jgi:3-deoxy-7-phosphoheptulonate synthase
MIVVMKQHCNDEAIDHVLAYLTNHGLTGHPSRGVERTVIGVLGAVGPSGTPGSIGGINPGLGEALEALPCVEQVLRISKPYKLASREFHPDDTAVEVPAACTAEGVVRIGGTAIVMMAGPCTVESEKQLMTTAEAVRKAGAVILRGGAFKPSTSPYGFRGLGEDGLKLLARARAEFGMAVITEVMTPADVPMVSEYADILQIGTRNMQNYFLLDEVGRTDKPVLLKRGMSSTIEEWLLAAEYILAQGNRNVILCERGIRTFEKLTRNTMDISAIPLIEVHPNPDEALKDGAQSLTIEQFQSLMPQIHSIATALGRIVVTE